MTRPSLHYCMYFVLAAALYFVFFQHLSDFHIRNWDESLFAVNAYEMAHNGNFIVPHFKQTPDLWNSKPPMQLWLQVCFIKIAGYNELAIRLPSAIASAVTALLLFFFVKRRSSRLFALTVFLVFVSSAGVSAFHTGRTGDPDAALSLFLTVSCLFYYKWLFENDDPSLLYGFIALALAFLTKSVAALLFVPAFLGLGIYFKRSPFKSSWFYTGLLLFLLVVVSFLLLREYQNKGYIAYFLKADIGRLATTIESHREPFDFYINNLFAYRFRWMLFVVPGALLLWLNQKTRPLCVFLSSLFLSYFLIVSCSTTKLEWYDLPLFPLLSILSAVTVYSIGQKLKLRPASVAAFLLVVFSLPLYYSFRHSYKSEIPSAEKEQEALTEYAFRHKSDDGLDGVVFLTTRFDRPLYFYKYMLNGKGFDYTITSSVAHLSMGQTVIVAEDSLETMLRQSYATELVEVSGPVHRIRLKAPAVTKHLGYLPR